MNLVLYWREKVLVNVCVCIYTRQRITERCVKVGDKSSEATKVRPTDHLEKSHQMFSIASLLPLSRPPPVGETSTIPFLSLQLSGRYILILSHGGTKGLLYVCFCMQLCVTLNSDLHMTAVCACPRRRNPAAVSGSLRSSGEGEILILFAGAEQTFTYNSYCRMSDNK